LYTFIIFACLFIPYLIFLPIFIVLYLLQTIYLSLRALISTLISTWRKWPNYLLFSSCPHFRRLFPKSWILLIWLL
jgi:hypothetical protein